MSTAQSRTARRTMIVTAESVDPHAALVEHMARRIRWAQHVGQPWAADQLAEEIVSRVERVIADGSAER